MTQEKNSKSAERIQKILARAGISSRRKAEELIMQGDVTVNGEAVKLGDKAIFGVDAIKVKGKLLTKVESPVYYLLNKPKGVISSLDDPEGRPSLSDFTKRIKERVYPVGRLDFNTDGLILLTNDGAIAERIQKDASILRFYHVKVKGHPNPEMLGRLKHRVKVGDEFLKAHLTRPIARLQNKSVILTVVRGAGAFDVRGYFEEKGFLVERVTRIGIGHLGLKSMVPGELKVLTESQVVALINQPELAERLLERTNEVDLTRPEDLEGFEGYDTSAESAEASAPKKRATIGGSRSATGAAKISIRPTGAPIAPKWGDESSSGSEAPGDRSYEAAEARTPRAPSIRPRGTAGSSGGYGGRSNRGPRREAPAPRFADRFNRSGQKTRPSRGNFGPSIVMPESRAEGRGAGSFENRTERGPRGPRPRGEGAPFVRDDRRNERSDRGNRDARGSRGDDRRDSRGPKPRSSGGGTGIRVRPRGSR